MYILVVEAHAYLMRVELMIANLNIVDRPYDTKKDLPRAVRGKSCDRSGNFVSRAGANARDDDPGALGLSRGCYSQSATILADLVPSDMYFIAGQPRPLH